MNVGSILNDDNLSSNTTQSKSTGSPTTRNTALQTPHQHQSSPSAPATGPAPAPATGPAPAPATGAAPSSSNRSSTHSINQRHSITSILNDSVQNDAPIPRDAAAQSSSLQQHQHQQPSDPQHFKKPISAMNSPSLVGKPAPSNFNSNVSSTKSSPSSSKRNSIANMITADSDKEQEQRERETTPSIHPSEDQEQQQQQQQQSNGTQASKEKRSLSFMNTEEDDLTRIKKLKKSNKPKRYEEPPIWAQRWIPPNEQKYHQNPHAQSREEPMGEVSQNVQISSKPVFDYTSTRYVDLQCSITGRIPPSSITRTIAEWIFANFANIEEHNRKFVELELKFGKIIDKRTGNRLNLNVTTECIYSDPSSIKFDMEVEEIAWKDVRKLFEELERTYQDEKLKDPQLAQTGPKRKFNVLESDKTDSFYQIGNKNEHLRRVRVSKDNLLKPPRYTAIQKDRIGDLYVHDPKSMYDLRLSLSLETPVLEANIESIMTKYAPPQLSREKKRTSWTHTPTVTQFDLTRVLVPKQFKNNKSGKTLVNHETKFEIEMEIDTLAIFSSIDKIMSGTDNFRLEELVEIFLNNSRVINNRVTKLAG
ncbi:uncharacterized protein LODBEIA_P09980 [Lodderomyces beijingensis]|uniref:mRNA-capping enzyme subunit beta n=1 Tax=Lodderomyces beijingensis TaxID=1775926 RepID=A0ABP0ZF40_9ASCO